MAVQAQTMQLYGNCFFFFLFLCCAGAKQPALPLWVLGMLTSIQGAAFKGMVPLEGPLVFWPSSISKDCEVGLTLATYYWSLSN